MRLGPKEVLVLEGAEDFDIHEPKKKSVTVGQVKDRAGNVTLRSKSVIEAINNYWDHRERNTDYRIIFRFMTTGNAGQEMGKPFGGSVKGIDLWNRARTDSDVKPSLLKDFLVKQNLGKGLKEFIQNSDDATFLDKLIRPIRWDMGEKPKEALIDDIESELIIHGSKQPDSVSPHHSKKVLLDLLHKIETLMASESDRSLRYSNFLEAFEEATTERVSRGQLERLRAASNPLSQASQHTAVFGGEPTALGPPTPLVDGAISRDGIVSDLANQLRQRQALFLQGSSGLGKTMLARLISDTIGGDWGWVGFRDRDPEHIRALLVKVRIEISALNFPAQVVLDDLDLTMVSAFERELITLLFSIINSDGIFIVTGPSECPVQLFPKIWLTEQCQASVPYFKKAEIADMIREHGLDHDKWTDAWAHLIELTTRGHPQLVHARVRNLSAQNWPTSNESDFINPEDVQHVRVDARRRLINELPSEEARIFMYRLSLMTGSFTRDMALFVGSVQPSVTSPGEVFDTLVGPWIEREQNYRYRISPLIYGAGAEVLSHDEAASIHEAVAIRLIKQKSMNQYEVGTALSHAFFAQSGYILLILAKNITTMSHEQIGLLEDAIFWFPMMGLEPGQTLYADNAATDLFLRLAQYRVAAFSSKPETAVTVINRILESLEKIDDPRIRAGIEVMAYYSILITITVPISSSTRVSLISRYMDLETAKDLPSEMSELIKQEPFEDDYGDLSPAQILFSIQAVQLSGLDDLVELLDSLEKLDQKKRSTLLDVCDAGFDFAGSLISRAWWKETQARDLDIEKSVNVLNSAIDKGKKWNAPKISRAAYVALSVIWDEYGKSQEKALEVLDEANTCFPDDHNLKNQLAKVLYHSDEFERSLELSKEVLDNPGDLPDVEAVFTCRAAGISAAKLGDWEQAGDLFLKGAEWTKKTDVLALMEVGLKADAAFARWKQGLRKVSLELFAEVLSELENHPISDGLQNRHLHATVRHCICWTQNDAQDRHVEDFVEPYPGTCSSQEPHEDMKDLQIVSTDMAWGLLAGTEKYFGIDIGISKTAERKFGKATPAMILINNRNMTLDGVWYRMDFENLIPPMIGFFETIKYASVLRKSGADRMEAGNIPQLPDGYWKNKSNCEMLLHHLISAVVVMTSRVPKTPLPLERWQRDLKKFGALFGDVKDVLRILTDDSDLKNNTLFGEAANALKLLRTGIQAPGDLFVCYFRLINALASIERWAALDLEEMAVRHWLYAVDSQRFAFTMPSVNCELIKEQCADQNTHGYAKVASILEVAAVGLKMNLDSNALTMLHTLKTESRTS